MEQQHDNILEVAHLSTDFATEQGTVHAVRDVSFHIKQGEVLGIVGESGSGKSVTMLSIMGLLSDNGWVSDGNISFDGRELSPVGLSRSELRGYERMMQGIRGNEIGMIFQDPMTYLNPVLRIDRQLMEPLLLHKKISRDEARKQAVKLMEIVGIPSPERRLRQYPHEFSGGMRQRVIIAIALACNPKLIIADEPTTALDVTIQAQVLELIKSLTSQMGSSVIMITHDLGVVASMCSRILIMYGGKIVEQGTDEEIFYDPKHPYTIGLLRSINNPNAEVKQELVPIPGSPPNLLSPPPGCPFVDRCDHAMLVCKNRMPDTTVFSQTHQASCWLQHPLALGQGSQDQTLQGGAL